MHFKKGWLKIYLEHDMIDYTHYIEHDIIDNIDYMNY